MLFTLLPFLLGSFSMKRKSFGRPAKAFLTSGRRCSCALMGCTDGMQAHRPLAHTDMRLRDSGCIRLTGTQRRA